ncbi:MAG: hypothetical protein GY714_27055 [Desulfobacterales bacterium]|nr:hypothetical protein [Desulfobacterales bacterium]
MREIRINTTNPTILPLEKHIFPLIDRFIYNTLENVTAILSIDMGVDHERHRFENFYSILSRVPNLKILRLSVFWVHCLFRIQGDQDIPQLIDILCHTSKKPFPSLQKLFMKADYHRSDKDDQMVVPPLPLGDDFLRLFRTSNILGQVFLQG